MAETEKEAVAEPELETEIVEEDEQDEFPWAKDDDEKRRSFIFVQMCDSSGTLSVAEIDGKFLVENMNLVDAWLKSGIVPQKAEPKLKAVAKNG